MSMNNLLAPYAGSSIAKSCSNQFCAVEFLFVEQRGHYEQTKSIDL